jgi:hypothetical protein
MARSTMSRVLDGIRGRMQVVMSLSPRVARRLTSLTSEGGHENWAETLQRALAIYALILDQRRAGYAELQFVNATGDVHTFVG